MKRESVIDFFFVPPKQFGMHDRLENWARGCFGGGGSSASPMFQQYRSTEVWHAPEASVPVDRLDASKIASGIAALPEPHRISLHWYYLKPVNPTATRKQLGVTMAMLARLVIDGRTMLINRRV